MTEEEFRSHKCSVRMTGLGIKDIVAESVVEMTKRDSEGHRQLVVQGLDGVLYWIVECKHNPPHTVKIRIEPSDENSHHDEPDDKVPKPRRASLICQNPYVLYVEQ